MTDQIDYDRLDREFSKVKVKTFLGKEAAFLGPLLCSLEFMWTTDHPTACTNGISIQWNPHFFDKLPKETRVTVLLHEIWHVALMHMIRRGHRDPRIWNVACDIYINNMLHRQGYSFEGTKPCLDLSYVEDTTAEDIYDDLIQTMPPGKDAWTGEDIDEDDDSHEDIIEPEEKDEASITTKIVSSVMTAASSAKLMGMGGSSVPGTVEAILKRFLKPKLPWERLFQGWFNELGDEDYDWKQRDRRYQDVYLPDLQESDSALDHIMFFQDQSGSVNQAEITRVNSEFKYVKDRYNPKKITFVTFDDCIQDEYTYTDEDRFDEIKIIGRGGTDLEPVRQHIIKHKPTAVVIFSDLFCSPMAELPDDCKHIPVLWIGVNAHKDSKVNFGTLIHIRE